ncbi:LPD29 domain-containing protein [Microlunatus spumicola]
MTVSTSPHNDPRRVPAFEVRLGGWLLLRPLSATRPRWYRVKCIDHVSRGDSSSLLCFTVADPTAGDVELQFAADRYESVPYAKLPAPVPDPARDVRTALRQRFPDTRFTVRPTVRGASVWWTDGPTQEQVVQVVRTVGTCERWTVNRRLSVAAEALQLICDQNRSASQEPSRDSAWSERRLVEDASPEEMAITHLLLALAHDAKPRRPPRKQLIVTPLETLRAVAQMPAW